MKAYRPKMTLITLAVMASVSLTCPQPETMVSAAHAKEIPRINKIIADTLAAHKVICLSRNGLIETVLLDGKWVDVQEVELINLTVILRTDAGNISLAAVIDNP